jgi:hypothetical protein
MRRIDDRERRARLGRRHHLAAEAHAADIVEAAGSLVGLHGSDPASVYLAAWTRLDRDDPNSRPEAMARALYDDRSVVRMLGMRRTMFLEPLELVPIVHAASSRANSAQQHRNTIKMLTAAGIGADPEAWLTETKALALAALAARGEATANELSAAVPRLREQIPVGEGTKWQGTIGVSTRVLFLLAAEGRIVRARPRGSWISSQYRWALMDAWLHGGLVELPTESARVELVRRWLLAFGPGTEADIRWWTGWTLGETRRALAGLAVVEVGLDDGSVGLVLADDLEPGSEMALGGLDGGPWVALLPALDPTIMGWTSRDWYLGAHRPILYDTNGNAGPTIWSDGRVVGGWAQRGDGEVVVRLLEDVGAEAASAVGLEAARLTEWLGSIRITPRFRTPLELELGR